MPPEGVRTAKTGRREAKTKASWVQGEFTRHALLIEQQRQEGRTRLRRLTRSEYHEHYVQDIFGIRPTRRSPELPVDGRVDGFDKVSSGRTAALARSACRTAVSEDCRGPAICVGCSLKLAHSRKRRAVTELWPPSRASSRRDTYWNCRTAGTCRSTRIRPPARWRKRSTARTTRIRSGFPRVSESPGCIGLRMHRLRLSNRQAAHGRHLRRPRLGLSTDPRIAEGALRRRPANRTIVEADVYLRTGSRR